MLHLEWTTQNSEQLDWLARHSIKPGTFEAAIAVDHFHSVLREERPLFGTFWRKITLYFLCVPEANDKQRIALIVAILTTEHYWLGTFIYKWNMIDSASYFFLNFYLKDKGKFKDFWASI